MNKTHILENLKSIINILDNKKAEDIRLIDISELTSIADYFIIVNANNTNQIKAFIDTIEENLEKSNIFPRQIEGNANGGWVLMDYSDFIIHIFDKESRKFYNLEKIWIDGKDIDITEFIGGCNEN